MVGGGAGSPPAFPHRLAGHCGSGALRDLLDLHGLDFGAGALGEGMVFGLGGGLGFFYARDARWSPPFYAVGRGGDLEVDLAHHLDVPVEVLEGDDPHEARRWVLDALSRGTPPVVWADIAELDYLHVGLSNTRHSIVVAGWDTADDVVWIADNDREELQRTSAAVLAAARSSAGFPSPNRHRTYVYDWPTALPDPRRAVHRAVERAVANMRGSGTSVGGLVGRHGLDGVQALADDFPAWPRHFGGDLDRALGGLWIFIVKAGTGGTMFRSLHAEFLHDAAGLLDDRYLRSAAEAYDRAVAGWLDLATSAKRRDQAACVPTLQDVVALEREGLTRMETWLGRSPDA
jgi:hypothetical protein